MLDIGFSELLLFGMIALLVLGPEKLPVAVRTAGQWYARLRRMLTDVQQNIEQELQLAEVREQVQNELARIKELEANMQRQLNKVQADVEQQQAQMVQRLETTASPADKGAP